MSILLQKMRNKVLKKIHTLPFIKYRDDLNYHSAIKNHIDNLPPLPKFDQEILAKITSEGVVITSLAELGISSTSDLLAAAQNIIPKISAISPQKNDFVIHANAQDIIDYPAIFYWGLEQRLLNIVENYLGLPISYNGVYFRRDIPHHIEQGSRLWHIDTEDRKILKIIIYLNDIHEDTGPFEYIPYNLSLEIVKALKYTSGYIPDERMRNFISPDNYKSCMGASGTVIFAATGSVFHRGRSPINGDRLAIFFDYNSLRQKKRYYLPSSFSRQDLLILSANLPASQKQCIYY
jgi:hypothetical protein